MRLSRFGQQHSRSLSVTTLELLLSPHLNSPFLLVDCCVTGRLSVCDLCLFLDLFTNRAIPRRTLRRWHFRPGSSSCYLPLLLPPLLKPITRHGSLKPNASCRPRHGYGHGKCCSWWCKCTLVASLSLQLSWMPLCWFLGGGQHVKLVYSLHGAVNSSSKMKGIKS